MNKKKIIMPMCMAAMTMSMMSGGMIHAETTTCQYEIPTSDSSVFTGTNTTNTFDVNANITKAQSTGTTSTVYRVDVDWIMPTLTATQAANSNTYVWDPASVSYKTPTVTSNATLTSSQEGNVSICVINKSNADISYSVSSTVASNYTFESGFEPTSQDAKTIAAADEKDDTTSGAYAMMEAGSADSTKLKGRAVSDTFTNKLKLATAPIQSTGTDNVEQTNKNSSVVKYTLSIKKVS